MVPFESANEKRALSLSGILALKEGIAGREGFSSSSDRVATGLLPVVAR
jgi:hypothetical protein